MTVKTTSTKRALTRARRILFGPGSFRDEPNPEGDKEIEAALTSCIRDVERGTFEVFPGQRDFRGLGDDARVFGRSLQNGNLIAAPWGELRRLYPMTLEVAIAFVKTKRPLAQKARK